MDQALLRGKTVMIFDMDGTLIDSVGLWNAVDERLIKRIREDGKDTLENIQEQRDAALRRFSCEENPYLAYCAWLKETYRSSLSAREIHTLRYALAQDDLQNRIDYKPGADECIRRLKARGYTLVIATTTRRSNMEIYRTRNVHIRDKANIDDYFDRVYTREDAREIKPHPEIYQTVLRELNVRAEECLVFEDSLIGLEAAKRAGIPSVAVYDRYSDADWSRLQEWADAHILSYAELLEAIG